MSNLDYLKSQPDAEMLLQMLGFIPTPGNGKHGQLSNYTKGGCRCELCKDAYRDYWKPRYVPKQRQPRPIKHGTAGAYNNRGCRCEECKAAIAAYHRDYWHRKRSPNRVSV